MTIKSFWLNLDSYELLHAAYLWNEQEPKDEWEYAEKTDPIISATIRMLKEAIKFKRISLIDSSGCTTAESYVMRIQEQVSSSFNITLETLIPRENLKKFADYIGFWGGVLNPPKEADINRLCNQFSLY